MVTDSQRLKRFFAGPIAPDSLVAFRVLFGLVMAANVVRYELEGWVHDLYIAPQVYFPYWGFEWVQPVPGPWMHLVFALIGLSALGIAAGFFYRASVAAFFVLFTYVELLDRSTYLNHYYLVSLVSALMLLMPLGHAGSWDARRRGAQPMPRWPLWVLRAQLCLVYVFAGLAKLRADWLFEAEPLRTWLARYTELPLLGGLMDEPALAYLLSWSGALFDLTIPVWLLWKRTRPYAYAVVVIFHLVTAMLFHIGIFPWLMICITTLFFAPDWVSRLIPRLKAQLQPSQSSSPPLPSFLPAALAIYFVVQLVLPLRQHLYPGSSCWHEQGYRFSWNVMVMEKTGMVDFRVRDPRNGAETIIHPREVLTPLQLRMMQTQPDMILHFAHYLRDRWRREGRGDVEVRVDAWASLNGRRAARLIDPEVNLAAIEDGWAPKSWILPSPRSADHR